MPPTRLVEHAVEVGCESCRVAGDEDFATPRERNLALVASLTDSLPDTALTRLFDQKIRSGEATWFSLPQSPAGSPRGRNWP